MTFTWFDCVAIIVISVTLFIYYIKTRPNSFTGTDVKYVKLFKKRRMLHDEIQLHYNSHADQKYVGCISLGKQIILLRDLSIIKQICIKDFDHFPNHSKTLSPDLDTLLGNSLFFLQDEKWKDMRSTLSPAFTSSKMRHMFVFIENCAKQVAEYYAKESEANSGDVVAIVAKDLSTRYANDVIANAAFGLEINSLKDTNNEFYKHASIATNMRGIYLYKMYLFVIFPKLFKFLGIEYVSKKTKTFFQSLVHNTMKYRRENSIIRKDMIQLLMEAEKGTLKHDQDSKETLNTGFATVEESKIGKIEHNRKWSLDEIAAQAFIFLGAGFDTTSNVITFLIYELVKNPDIQTTLQKEIDEYISMNNKHVSYDDLSKLKYLDNCVSETLRLWPVAAMMDRVCAKEYTLPPPNEDSNLSFKVKPEYVLWIPIHAIHHDPEYFPNPEKFDPDRYSEENRSSINTNAYMPFGIGPRNCIGSRFALMVVKLIMIHILAKFDIVVTEKTQIPLKLYVHTFNFVAKDGVCVGLKARNF